MTTPTFTPPAGCGITTGTSAPTKPRVRKAEFGDGYIQRSADGINSVRRTSTVKITTISFDDAETIESFFRARRGVEAFWWTFPVENVARKWVCESWTVTAPNPVHVDIQAEFTEVFDP